MAVTTGVLTAGAALYGAKEGRDARKDANAERDRIKLEEEARQKKLDDELALEKAKKNEELKKRLYANASASTIFAGLTGKVGKDNKAPSLLGEI